MSEQPKWKHVGGTGDVDPIAYGGGFVYVDETGVYAPEMTYFDPESDEEWHEHGENTPLRVHRVVLEREPEKEWWWDKLPEVASTCGSTVEEFQADARSEDPLVRARVYGDLIQHFGVEEFDSYPNTTTEGEAYEQYKEEMRRR